MRQRRSCRRGCANDPRWFVHSETRLLRWNLRNAALRYFAQGEPVEKLSYLTTFVALIYGLGIANVLAHLSTLLKRGKDADWYWVHTLWTLYLILFMATLWWVQLNWGAVRHIAYFQYLSLLLMPALVYVASDLLVSPERQREGTIALKVHFFAIKHRLFLLLLAMLLSETSSTPP